MDLTRVGGVGHQITSFPSIPSSGTNTGGLVSVCVYAKNGKRQTMAEIVSSFNNLIISSIRYIIIIGLFKANIKQ
jgi:hypothetical protein